MTDMTPYDFTPAPAGPRVDPNAGLPMYDANLLTEGGRQAVIALDGQLYQLRITRAGKLILTK